MTPDREAILDLIVRWEDARARGQAVTPEELCRDRPDLLGEFRRQVGRLGGVEWLNGPVDTDPTSAAGPPPPEPGLPRLLADRYRLDALVGEGGFGRVYRGFDTWLERTVAVKVPRADRPVTSGELDLCRVEARKVARLRHPHVVPVHDVGRDGGTCFIVGEWVEGVNLAWRIRHDPPGPREAARIAAEVAGALAHAHAHGFVHRDVKPANVLIDGEGRAFLTDFGIAVLEEELLGDVSAAGTLAYMAPEQLDDGLGPVDHRADLYALGVVLYELLNGRRPPPPGAADPGPFAEAVPPGLAAVCLRCLARRPEDRYPRADDVRADLLAGLGPGSGEPPPP